MNVGSPQWILQLWEKQPLIRRKSTLMLEESLHDVGVCVLFTNGLSGPFVFGTVGLRWCVTRIRTVVKGFSKIAKASSWLSVRMEQLGSHWVDFHGIWYLRIFENLWKKCQVLLIIWQWQRGLRMKTNVHFLYMWLIYSQNETCFRGKLFIKSKHMCEKMWKNIVEPDRPEITWLMQNCMLNTKGCKHAPRICSTYCFSTETMDARTRLNITLHGHCLSCWHLSNHRRTCKFLQQVSASAHTTNNSMD
jgi:hypothetical protein